MKRTVLAFEAVLSRTVEIFTRVALAAITLIMTWQVFGRYILKSTPKWAEESAVVMIIWFGMLGAALGVRDHIHLRVEILLRALNPGMRRVMEAAAHLLILAFAVALIISGFQLVNFTMDASYTVIRMPVGYAYLAIPVSGFFIAFYTLLNLFGLNPVGRETDESD